MKHSNIATSLIWFLIATILSILSINSSSMAVHTLLVIANIYSYIRCIRIWGSKGNSYLSLYTFFILYMGASNLGQCVISLIPSSLNELSIYNDFYINEIIASLRFQLLCVSAMGLGTALYIDYFGFYYTTNDLINKYQELSPLQFPSQLFIKVIFLCSIVIVIYDALSYLIMRQTMGYMDVYTERQLAGIPFYQQLANWLVILLGFYFAFTKRYTKFIIITFIVLICIFLLCGNRSLTIKYLAFLIILCPIIYPHYFQRKYLVIWSIFAIGFISMMSIISSVRNDIGVAIQVAGGQYSFGDMLIDSVAEMGGSINTLIYTMNAIREGFNHHLTELYFFITAFSSSKLCYILGIGGEYLPLGEWVGEYAGIRGYGLGYSCLAEWYMNYGWFGFIFSAFYAYLITMFECISYKKILRGEYLIPIVLLTFLCTNIFYARSSLFYSLFDVRYGFYLILIYKLVYYKK